MISTDNINSFNKLYNEYYDRFVRFANVYVRDEAVAEDIAVDALMYYWENRYSINNESNIPAYILTMIKNKCLNHLRHLHIRDEFSESIRQYQDWELSTRIATLEACEPNELFTIEIQDLIQEALNQMPERTRAIFILNRYENKSYKEIALEMNISYKGVDYHISKALKILHVYLKDYLPFFYFFFN
ncbi:MAG: RNA polymerase sigma-70 factor [Tannerellaceae bacterium]|nr:RNA polymerase sigma-70 factor [Tannerellaceae bacterium]